VKIAVTTDHAGYEALKELKTYLESLGHECVDYGPKQFNVEDDYPSLIFPAARAVASGECERGIILGGSGQGEAMVANRVQGVRCALFYGLAVAKVAVDADGLQSTDPYEIVKLSRQHNDSNVLSLSARFLTQDEMKQAVKIWLETSFSGAERHARRVRKIDEAAA
jgi:ribose 5-phosphate isomerase B